MALSIAEQEFYINSSRDDDFAVAYASDRTWITKLDKLVKKSPDFYEVIAETDYGKTYRFPKKLISLRSSIVSREMTDEEKELATERLKDARAKKANA